MLKITDWEIQKSKFGNKNDEIEINAYILDGRAAPAASVGITNKDRLFVSIL
jgi:hypothetical protein